MTTQQRTLVIERRGRNTYLAIVSGTTHVLSGVELAVFLGALAAANICNEQDATTLPKIRIDVTKTF